MVDADNPDPKTEKPNADNSDPKKEKPKAEQSKEKKEKQDEKQKPEQSAVKSKKSDAKLLEEQVYAVMKTLQKNGITEFTSTLLRDKLQLDKESGRGKIRTVMKRLAKQGKVTMGLKKNTGKRKQYVYKLKE